MDGDGTPPTKTCGAGPIFPAGGAFVSPPPFGVAPRPVPHTVSTSPGLAVFVAVTVLKSEKVTAALLATPTPLLANAITLLEIPKPVCVIVIGIEALFPL